MVKPLPTLGKLLFLMIAVGNTRTGGLPDSLCDSAYTVVTVIALRGAQMHIIIAQMSHETNTYSPVISDSVSYTHLTLPTNREV